MTRDVQEPKDLPSVVQIEDTACVPTLSTEENSDFHNLSNVLKLLTCLSVVLNTSLYAAGLSMAKSKNDALRKLFISNPFHITAFRHVVVREKNSTSRFRDMIHN